MLAPSARLREAAWRTPQCRKLRSRSTACAVSTEAGRPAFDLDRPWCLDRRVAVRPEPSGALLYHFGNRRLSFLKDPTVLAVIRGLAEHPSARLACESAGVTAQALPAYERALAALARSEMICERDGR